jgi:hypothetical protein
MKKKKKYLNEFGGFSYGAGPGFPDTNSGKGYGRASQGMLGTMRQYPQGYPYTNTLEDMMFADVDEDEDEIEDDVDHETFVKIRNTTLADRKTDATYNNVADRRSFASSNNQGMFNYGTFGESSLIRLRPRSSEPSHGTMYGWSHPHLTTEPDIQSDETYYRYSDIINGDENEDQKFHRLQKKHDNFIRKCVRIILQNDRR